MAGSDRAVAVRRWGSLLAGVVGLGLVLGGVAAATVPTSTTGQIAACYRVSTGALRVIDVQKRMRCGTGERLLVWGPTYAWKGGYRTGSAYPAGSVVLVAGSSYVARVAVPRGVRPATPTGARYWGLLAAAGSVGPAGPAGPVGPTGPKGDPGAAGGAIPSGSTVTGMVEWEFGGAGEGATFSVALPGDPGKVLTQADVNFSSHGAQAPGVVGDSDRECTGTPLAPTAPAGRVCLYLVGASAGLTDLVASGYNLRIPSFYVTWHTSNPAFESVQASWAYTAP